MHNVHSHCSWDKTISNINRTVRCLHDLLYQLLFCELQNDKVYVYLPTVIYTNIKMLKVMYLFKYKMTQTGKGKKEYNLLNITMDFFTYSGLNSA